MSEQDRQTAVDNEVANAPETPWHRLLNEFHACVPTNFITKYEKLVGRTAQQVRAEAEAKFPKTE